MSTTKHDSFKLILTIVVIELVSGYLQGFYEPLLPEFSALLAIDASNLSLFNVLPTAVGALFVPFFTRLGDIRGYRKILRIAISCVFLASIVLMVGVVTHSWLLVCVGRLFFGAVPVWLPLHIALVHAKTQGQRATKAVSAIVATVTVGTVLGTATSGPLYELLGRSLTATVAIIPALTFLAVLLVFVVMPEFVSGAHPHIDKLGFILLALLMFLAIMGFVIIVDGSLLMLLAGATLLLAAAIVGIIWFRYEKRQEYPAIDVRLLLSRSMAPLYIGAVCMGAVFFGFLSPIATYLAHPPAAGFGFGFGPTAQSIAQTAILFCTVLAAVLVPFVLKLLSPKTALALGFILGIIGFAQFALLPDSWPQLICFITLIGIGIGIINAAIPVLIPQRAPQNQRGIATGLYNSSQTLGGALGGGLFLSLLKIGSLQGVDAASVVTETGYDAVWAACAAFLAIGLIVVVAFLAKDAPHYDGPADTAATTDTSAAESGPADTPALGSG